MCAWRRWRCLLLCLPACWLSPLAAADKPLVFAAVDYPPYIGQEMPQKGYVAELVNAVFAKAGYRVEIRFYPSARARSLAASGEVDGLLPATGDPALNDEFLLSSAFPGVNVGLLKNRTLALAYPASAPQHRAEVLQSLSHLRFGALRGAAVAPEFDTSTTLKRELVSDDLQNLDKLALGRIDLMVVDKYRASDLMILNRPHLIGTLEFLNPPLFQQDFHIAFSRRGTQANALKTAFDIGLLTLDKQGGLDEILARHGLNRSQGRTSDPNTLTIGTVNNPDMLIMKSLSGQFEKQNPGVRLEWRVLEENSLRTRLMSDLALNDGQFDVMTIGSFEAPIWARRGWLKPLELPPAYEAGDLLPPVRDSLSREGKLYALPFYGESSMTYYRTDLFRKAGLSMPTQPTYSEIRRLAAALHDPAHGIYGICLRGKVGWGENIPVITSMVNAFGGRWFNDKWQPEMDQPAWKKAVALYVDLQRDFGPPNVTHNGFNESLKLFADGHCAIWVDATVAAGLLYNPKNSRVAGNLGFARAPAETTAVGANWLWVWSLGIPESSNKKALARRFIEWATSKNYIATVAKREGWVSAPPGTRQSTYANPEYKAAAPFADFVRDAILNTNPKPAGRNYSGIQWVGIPEFPAIGYLTGLEIAKAVNGLQTSEQALQNARSGIVRLMQDSGYLQR